MTITDGAVPVGSGRVLYLSPPTRSASQFCASGLPIAVRPAATPPSSTSSGSKIQAPLRIQLVWPLWPDNSIKVMTSL